MPPLGNKGRCPAGTEGMEKWDSPCLGDNVIGLLANSIPSVSFADSSPYS